MRWMRKVAARKIDRSRPTLKFVNFISPGPLGTRASRAETSRSSLLLALLLLASAPASGASISLAWDPPTGPVPSGYFVYYGSVAGDYKTKIDAGNATTLTIPGLVDGSTYHFAATSYDSARRESAFSNDLSATISGGPLTADLRSPQRRAAPRWHSTSSTPPLEASRATHGDLEMARRARQKTRSTSTPSRARTASALR